MTSQNKALRVLGKVKHNFKFVSWKNGKAFVKQSESDKTVPINSELITKN